VNTTTTTKNTARALFVIAAAALLSACGGGKESVTPASDVPGARLAHRGGDSQVRATPPSTQERAALRQRQAQQDAAFGVGKAGTSFKADAVVNQIRFVADFDGDGKDDILWQTTADATHISFMNAAAVDRCAAVGVQTDRIMGTGDFNGDGKADIVWRNMTTGAVRISLMDGGSITQWLIVGQNPIALNVKLEAVGDFDGNGRADMLWRNQSTGNSVMSQHAADGSVTGWPQVSRFINPANTKAMHVGDFDGDGKDDIVWRNLITGNVVVGLMNGHVPTWLSLSNSPTLPIVALEAMGDFDGDGQAELLWRHTQTGRAYTSDEVYGLEFSATALYPYSNYINPTTTSVHGVGDFDGDGKDDILWRNLSSGNTVISLMDSFVRRWEGFSFSTCPVVTDRLPHSGVTAAQCFRAASEALVACNSAEALALNSRQDGHRIAVNPMTYSEVPNPAGGHFARTACVKDNVTGLIWEGKEATGLRAGGNIYTNYDDPTLPQRYDGSAYVNPTLAEVHAASNSVGHQRYVNSIALCGFNDWRLPTADELLGIVDYGVTLPAAINAAWFPHTEGNPYWSSSPYTDQGHSAVMVGFYSGSLSAGNRGPYASVRLVRGEP
jgi:hypothetical protein